MRLHPEPFEQVKLGQKKIECRLNDEKRQQLAVGDVIEFQLRPECTEVIEKQICALHHFSTFEEMFTKFPEERINNVYQYYTTEGEQKWGVLAIEFK